MTTDVTIDLPATRAPGDARAVAKAGRKRLPLIIVGIVVIAAVTWGVREYLWGLHHESTDNAQLDGHITVIAPQVQAFVSRVLVDDNQHVKAGDTLVVLDDRDLKVRLQQAEADLANAAAAAGNERRGGQARSQLAWSRAQQASAQAAVASADANYKKAAADLERIRGLAANKIVAAQQLDAAQAAYDAAVAELESARKQAAAAGDQVAVYGAALSGAGARLAAAQSAVDNARLQLSYTYILAPTDGVIARRSAETGALVQIGQTLMSIVPDRGLWVTANLKETQLENVRVGDPATFTVDAYGNHEFHGHVESLSPATGARFALLPPDNATGNYTKVVQRVPVRIRVDSPPDPTYPLRPGMSVVPTITTR
jgi:membrane fusion protein (multidrug efflux system)